MTRFPPPASPAVPHGRRWGSVAVMAAIMSIAGLLGGSPNPAAATVEAIVKPPITGLLHRSGFPATAAVAHLSGFVVNAYWRDLQPSAGGPVVVPNAIDTALSQVRTRAPGLRIKVRIMAGTHAPEWAKNLGGPPVQMYEPVDGGEGTVPRWWAAEYRSAYAGLVAQLAARYDAEPEILDWTVSGAMTFYAEPFLRQVNDARNGPALVAAGYSVEADKAAIKGSVDAHRAFATTRSSLAFNGYQYFRPDATSGFDQGFSTEMMDHIRSVLGTRGVLENNSLASPLKPGMDGLYDAIAARGPSITYQTATSIKVGSLAGALQWAVDRRATAVELPGGYPYRGDDTLSDAQLDSFDAALRANAGTAAAGMEAPGPDPGPSPAPAGAIPNVAAPGAGHRSGYWMIGRTGATFAFGDAAWLGNTEPPQGTEVVDLEPTPSGRGYWTVTSGGQVYAHGDARYLGGTSALHGGETVTSLSGKADGSGYWIFTSLGRVFGRGDAPHLGDMGKVRLNGAVLDSIVTPSGRGYYMVGSDGGIFAFGDARFHGSMGNAKLNAPVQALVPDPDGRGYWLVASDGGIFAFESAFYGSMGGRKLNRPVTGMVGFGNGYMMVAEDGGVFSFGGALFKGSLGTAPPAQPIVSAAVLSQPG